MMAIRWVEDELSEKIPRFRRKVGEEHMRERGKKEGNENI